MRDEDKKLIEEVEALDAAILGGPWVRDEEDDTRGNDGGIELWRKSHGEAGPLVLVAQVFDDAEALFIARARELLPKLAARLKTLLDVPDVPPPPPKLPEPLVDGFYWVRLVGGHPQIARRRTSSFGVVEWGLAGFDDVEVTPLLGPLLPPNVTK